MKRKLIVLLYFIMILSLTVVACKKNNSSESEPTSTVESVSASVADSQIKDSYFSSVSVQESVSTPTSQKESASESVKESEKESVSASTSQKESASESQKESEKESVSTSEKESEKESESDVADAFITVSVIIRSNGGDTPAQEISLPVNTTVDEFIDILSGGDPMAREVIRDILVDGVSVIDDKTWAFAQSCEIIVVVHSAVSVDSVPVTATIAFADGQYSDPMEIYIEKGITAVEMVVIILGGDEAALQSVTDVVVDGEPVSMDWILTDSCEVLIVMGNMPPFGACEVFVVGDDTDGNKMYDMCQMVEQGTSVYDALVYTFGFTQEDLDKIVSINLGDEEIYDLHSAIITEDCEIYILISNISGGEIDYMAVMFMHTDANGNQSFYNYPMKEEYVRLEDMLMHFFARTYEELAKEGNIYVEGEEYVDANTMVRAGSTVRYIVGGGEIQDSITVYFYGEAYEISNGLTVGEFLCNHQGYTDLGMYNIYVNGLIADQSYTLCDRDSVSAEPIGDMGGYNVWFDVDGNGELDGMEMFFVPEGTTLEYFVNDHLVYYWQYTFINYDSAAIEGYFTVNGEQADRDYILNPEDLVDYVHTAAGEGCDHNFDEYGYCSDCGFACPHTTTEIDVPCDICGFVYVRSYEVIVYMLYAYETEEGYQLGGVKSGCYYRELYYHESEISIGEIISSYFGFDMSSEDQEGTVRYWLRNGESVYYGDIAEDGDVIIGIPEGVKISPFSVTVEVEEGQSATYNYDYPILSSMVFDYYEAQYGEINLDNYYIHSTNDFGESIYEDIICENVTIRLALRETSVTFKTIDENGASEEARYTYRIDQKPTLKEFLEEKGISEEEYYIYSSSDRIYNVEDRGLEYYNLTAIKKNIASAEFTVNLTYYNEYGDSMNFEFIFNEPVAMERFWCGIEDANGEYVYIQLSREDIIDINGEKYDFMNDGDPSYIFVYNDAEIVIKRGYYICLEVDYQMHEAIFEERVTGQEILSAFGLEIDLDEYLIQHDGYNIEKEMFLNDYYPYDGINRANFYFSKGRVTVDYSYCDAYGGWYSESADNGNSKISISDFMSEETFNSCTWTVYLISENYEENCLGAVTDYNYVFEFDRSTCDYWGCSRYRLKGETKQFVATLYIDGEWIGEEVFNKADKLTFGQILAHFGDYNYGDYVWSCYGDGYDVYEDSVITNTIEAWGYDNRPRFTLYVEGTDYIVFHTEDMTLAEVIEAVNAEYGVSINYDDYIWDYGTQLEDTVVTEGNWGEISARTLSSVEVWYYTDYSPAWFEDGSSNRIYSRGDEFAIPTQMDTSMYYDIVVPTGRWIYRGTESNPCEIAIKTVDDLFALQLEYVELYAELVIDYERLYGTYVTENNYVIIINENGLTYINGNESFTELKNAVYEVFFTSQLWIESEGRFIDGLYLQEHYKIKDDQVVIFAGNNFYCDRYDDVASFEAMIGEYVRIVSITNAEGEAVEGITSGVYFVTLEKIEEY